MVSMKDSKHLDLPKALRHLNRDNRFRSVIKGIGKPDLRHTRNAFESLVRAIVYQQISGKAAASILAKFLAAIPHRKYPTPKEVLATPMRKLRGAGLSKQKVLYIRDLAAKFDSGYITPKKFPHMSDEEIRDHLIAVKGIGRWSADMFLMFSLNRPDVLPTGDLGIQKGFQKLFNMRKLPNAKVMEKLAKSWQPYRTVACWYLWRIVDTRTPGK